MARKKVRSVRLLRSRVVEAALAWHIDNSDDRWRETANLVELCEELQAAMRKAARPTPAPAGGKGGAK